MFYISYFPWTIPVSEHTDNEHSWKENNAFGKMLSINERLQLRDGGKKFGSLVGARGAFGI